MIDLDALEATARAATPGPWRAVEHGGSAPVDRWWTVDRAEMPGRQIARTMSTVKPDAAFIAAASPDVVLALVERVRAAEARAAEPCGDDSLDGAACLLREGHTGMCSDGIASWEGRRIEDADPDAPPPSLVPCPTCGTRVHPANVDHCRSMLETLPEETLAAIDVPSTETIRAALDRAEELRRKPSRGRRP